MLDKVLDMARDKAIEIVKNRTAEGKGKEGDFSEYSERHKKRRSEFGLNTTRKDLRYTGGMMKNFKETNREVTPAGGEITISFSGQANRRADQAAASNQDVAGWLSEQEDVNIAGLTEAEKKKIIEEIEESGIVENTLIHD